MFSGIFNLLSGIIDDLVYFTVDKLIAYVYDNNYLTSSSLSDTDLNLTLFSDNPIISTNMYDFLILFFTIFYSMFFIILLYKATKKFITMVFGVFRV